jgi:hypothetical protein
MRGEPGFFDIEDRLKELSAKGDDLERFNAIVDFEMFRADLERAVPRSDRSKGGRPTTCTSRVRSFALPPPGLGSRSWNDAAISRQPSGGSAPALARSAEMSRK